MRLTHREDIGHSRHVFFYVQHLLGVGHLARASQIASALVEAGFAVTLVSGGARMEGFSGKGIKRVQLPPVVARAGEFKSLTDEHGIPVDRKFEQARAELLVDAYRQARPDVVIIEAFPFGRRQMRFELLPLIQAIAATAARPLLYCSIRDILQANRKAGRDQETVEILRAYFDGVLVHGDPTFARLEETFPLAADISDLIQYTGLVAPGKPDLPTESFDTVVSAGGGAVGASLIKASLEARALLKETGPWCVISGPNLPQSDYDELAERAGEGVSIYRFRSDFRSLLCSAGLSISQSGYNTVCDLLRARCRALLVPFAAGGETEQSVRAERLEALGFASVVPEPNLSGVAMAQAITAARALRLPEKLSISLEGAADTARFLAKRLASRS